MIFLNVISVFLNLPVVGERLNIVCVTVYRRSAPDVCAIRGMEYEKRAGENTGSSARQEQR